MDDKDKKDIGTAVVSEIVDQVLDAFKNARQMCERYQDVLQGSSFGLVGAISIGGDVVMKGMMGSSGETALCVKELAEETLNNLKETLENAKEEK